MQRLILFSAMKSRKQGQLSSCQIISVIQYSGTVTIIPVTSKNLTKIYPFEVYLPNDVSPLKKNSKAKAKADQTRPLDKARLIKSMEMLNAELVTNIDYSSGHMT